MIESILIELFISILGNFLQQFHSQELSYIFPELIAIAIVGFSHFVSKLLAQIEIKLEFNLRVSFGKKKLSDKQ